MREIIILNKKEGETPLLALDNFRKKNPEYLNVPMTYAGRLDPMASGVLVILAGKGIKDKEKYLALGKEYDFSVLFGFSTDTYDILGRIVEDFKGKVSKKDLLGQIKINLKSFKGKISQKYPIYSSKTVNGKPLFSYARLGQDVEIPERGVFVKKIRLMKIKKISAEKLLLNIEKRIIKVKGDFRQKEILKIWRKKLNKSRMFFIADFNLKCTSGTYVRTIADSLGQTIEIPSLAFAIKRVKLGKFK